MCRLSIYLIAMFGGLLSSVHSAHAQDGALDPTFASTGRTTFSISAAKLDAATAVSALSDGRLLLAGDCGTQVCLVRLKVDGSFDTTYGQLRLGYEVLTVYPYETQSSEPPVKDMIILGDGRAAEVGYAANSGGILIVKADGSGLDTSVGGGNGYFVGTQGSLSLYNFPIRVRQQTDGKFIVLQSVKDSTYGSLFAVSRIASDLSGLDSSFGSEGVVEVAFGLAGANGNADNPEGLVIQPDGKIVVAGYGVMNNGSHAGEFARLLSNGQFDTSFGAAGDGRLTVSVQNLRVFDLDIDSNQRLVFGGSEDDGTTYLQTVGRLTPSGVLDPTFNGGLVTYASASGTTGSERVDRVVAQPSGVIAVGEIPQTNGNSAKYFEVTRLDASGRKVSTFGSGGSSYTSFAASDETDPFAAVVTKQGVVVAGSSINSVGLQIGVARLTNDDIFSSNFER